MSLGSGETEPTPKGLGETEPVALGETKTVALGSGKMEPAPKGSGETEPAVVGFGRDLLIRLEPFGEISVGANFLTLGIPNIDTRQGGFSKHTPFKCTITCSYDSTLLEMIYNTRNP